MQTQALHGDVIAGLSTYDELDHELVEAELSGYSTVHAGGLAVGDEWGWGWSADGEEFTDEHMRRMRHVIDRLDADVQADVLRLLRLDCLVPMTVGAHVCDGIVTLTGTVGADRERECAKYLTGLVPGVFGVLDELACQPSPAAADADVEATKEAVAAALTCTAIRDVAELTIEAPRPGTVVVSGAVHSPGDHGLAIATAWSVADVEAVDDCIQVDC